MDFATLWAILLPVLIDCLDAGTPPPEISKRLVDLSWIDKIWFLFRTPRKLRKKLRKMLSDGELDVDEEIAAELVAQAEEERAKLTR